MNGTCSLSANYVPYYKQECYDIRMGPIGIQELVLILIIALVFFGPKRLPELGRSLGKTLAEFRRASNEIKQSIEKELQDDDEKIKDQK